MRLVPREAPAGRRCALMSVHSERRYTVDELREVLRRVYREEYGAEAQDDEALQVALEMGLEALPERAPTRTMEQASERLKERLSGIEPGSRFAGLAKMFDGTVLDGGEGMEAVTGLAAGVPSPLMPDQHAALLIALTLAVLSGYEVGRTA